MLTYQDVVTAKLESLSSAAAKWDEMAGAFNRVESVYKGKVLSVAKDGVWVGTAASGASYRFTGTQAELAAAQTQAKAIASLLRDAHSQLTTLVQRVKGLVADAQKEGMHIDSGGRATFDFSKVKATRNDPDYQEFRRKCLEAETSWTESIKKAVQAVDDADQGAKYALRTAAGVRTADQTLHNFNARAVGDIEIYEAEEAEAYAKRLLRGGKLSAAERAELTRLYRDNANDQVFSRTMLDSLGPEDTIKVANKFNDLAYFDDTGNKQDYLAMEKGLANTINGATRIPNFKDADGKRIPYGSKAYRDAYVKWAKTKDAEFYNNWREGLRKAGIEKYDLEVAANQGNGAKSRDQQVRGYQSLITLMRQGDPAAPQFLADVTDDMIAAEKKDKDIWDLYGDFHGKKNGWFANDPVDGALEMMSRDPKAATAYLDPGAEGKDPAHRNNDRLHYLLKERDWKFVNNEVKLHGDAAYGGNSWHDASDTEGSDSRKGLGAAIEAAATGSPSGSERNSDGKHTVGQARVLEDTIAMLDEENGGDSVHKNLQTPLARTLADYAPDTHKILSDRKEDMEGVGHIESKKGSVIRVLRGVSDSPENFAMLYEAERAQAAQYLTEAESRRGSVAWATHAHSAGAGIGVFNAIGADIILDDRDARKGWADDVAKYAYHGVGTPLTPVPVIGDAAQRIVDAATYEWANDMKNQADEAAKNGSIKELESKSQDLHELIKYWAEGRNLKATDPYVYNMHDEAVQQYDSARSTAFTDLKRNL
ncbi:hypothetical protein I5Q34_00655 [Streptomyces sp. AV19]|uniref:hypothetical protein n=1 Tax=Streptomyces sp. AV19 TaxID=2793068 RepID=UPI0018FE4D8D|nr:hypothetical protein [Streptomyces sp. AV19]MBH1932818.1 hypothetical protein [Streptomyces sp. AV19]MDG4531483.1 hypothetical protein [Streptomyces sp. AV19]